jgi:methionyl-tRNA formyltransferase
MTNILQLATEGAGLERFSSEREIRAKILFLGYSKEHTKLIEELCMRGCEVWWTEDKISELEGFDFIVSFGYRHIINKPTLDECVSPVINLHISYLPWNRGAHPNFWAFYDGTPSGVSIHLIDEGIDTGPIIAQRKVIFDETENTFLKTYLRLKREVEDLFIEKIDDIIESNFKVYPQVGSGTYHKQADLPKSFRGWDSIITAEIERLRKEEMTGNKNAD